MQRRKSETRDEHLARCREKDRVRYAKNRDSILAKKRALYPSKKSESLAANKKWRDKNPLRVKENNLRKYGITLVEFNSMLSEQGGACAICRNPEDVDKKRNGRPDALSVDHDHATGRIRGLLCSGCNRMLGIMNDDPNLIRSAAAYLESHIGENK